MTLAQLLPSLSALPHSEKLQLMTWLADQLTREEGVSPLISGADYAVWTPYGSYEAAAELDAFLDRKKATLCQ